MTEKNKLFRSEILKALYFEDSLSCASPSGRINKSFPITTKLQELLIAENLVVETGYAESTGGRRPFTYSLQKKVMYVVAVAMGQFVTKIAVTDVRNEFFLGIEKIALALFEYPAALDVLKKRIVYVIKSSGIPAARFIGIGIQ